MSSKKKKLILWDLDGTLMHCGADGTRALNETFHKLYGIEDAFTKAGIGHAMDSVILDRILSSNGLNMEDLENIKLLYTKNLKEILDHNVNKRILPGIKELLQFLQNSNDCFSGLLTSNLKSGAEIKLQSVGLCDYFSVGGFGDAYGEKWDAAEASIIEAEKYFGVRFDKDNIFIVGDSIYDIQCAKKIGVVSIGVATGFASYDMLKSQSPDFLYEDMSKWQEIALLHQWIKT
ncbi:HAD family hydrolase [Anoxybacterium hadale]|uniref:HAD family hydrolase n=1 Tax=Anoxybacterium hadale TaxID=3408580 RepID=A0ACD1A9S4_9FIRM|nr:HAD family hydrolase [Clostridiales bacterium]